MRLPSENLHGMSAEKVIRVTYCTFVCLYTVHRIKSESLTLVQWVQVCYTLQYGRGIGTGTGVVSAILSTEVKARWQYLFGKQFRTLVGSRIDVDRTE